MLLLCGKSVLMKGATTLSESCAVLLRMLLELGNVFVGHPLE